MPSLVRSYEYDIFISYRQKDNRYDGWVTEFVNNLRKELEATFKEEISIYFDENPSDGILETYDIDKSLEGKLKSLIFIPIISQTYCDPKSFAWQNEFIAFNSISQNDYFGRDIKIENGNVASRILPVKIHELDSKDKKLIGNVLNGPLRAIEFIYNEPGVNRPLTPYDDEKKNLNKTRYRNQINKVANSIKEIINSLKSYDQNFDVTEKASYSEKLNYSNKNYRRILGAVIILVLLITAVISITLPHKHAGKHQGSIAILPFKSLSNDPDKQYLADGMMEAILLNLQKFGDLRVMSRTSVEQYRSTRKRASAIGQELDVQYLLEGSFQKDGDNARLIVQLIRANEEIGSWSHEYNRNWKDIFSVQSDVAQAIAGELHTVISPEVKKMIETEPTTNFTAYDLYLKAIDYHKVYTKVQDLDSYQKAISFYKAALELDSAFARAYSGLGNIYFERYSWKSFFQENYLDSCIILADKALSFDDQIEEAFYTRGLYFEDRGNINEAFENFDKALKINPNYYLAYSAKGRIYTNILFDYVKGIDNFEKALDLIHGDERPLLLQETGWAFLDVGFFENARRYFKEKFILDSNKASYFYNLGGLEFILGNFENALKLDKQGNEIDPSELVPLHEYIIPPGHLNEAYEYSKKVLGYFKKTGTLNFHESHRIGYIYWQMGKKAEADSCFRQQIKYCEENIKLSRSVHWRYAAHYDLAATYAFLGNKDKAYKYLDEFNQRDFFPLWWLKLAKNDPLFASVKNEDRFQKIIQNMEDKNQLEHNRVRVWLENQKSSD